MVHLRRENFSPSYSVVGTGFALMISKFSTQWDSKVVVELEGIALGEFLQGNLKKLELDDSISFLPFLFFLDQIPHSMEEVVIFIGDQDSCEFGDLSNILIHLAGREEIIRITNGEESLALIQRLLHFLTIKYNRPCLERPSGYFHPALLSE